MKMIYVPFYKFVEHLGVSGENTELYQWLDFYTLDSIYTLMEEGLLLGTITMLTQKHF
jgi:hypothetical protein